MFLDDASLLDFQAKQKKVHHDRIASEGLPGYIDRGDGNHVRLTLFPEGGELFGGLKQGMAVRLAPAGKDRRPLGEPVEARLMEMGKNGRYTMLTLQLADPAQADRFAFGGVARAWFAK